MGDTLLRQGEVAKRLGITRAGVSYLLKKRYLIPEERYSLRLIPQSEVERYLANRPKPGRKRKPI